jgi:hypothetical protein
MIRKSNDIFILTGILHKSYVILSHETHVQGRMEGHAIQNNVFKHAVALIYHFTLLFTIALQLKMILQLKLNCCFSHTWPSSGNYSLATLAVDLKLKYFYVLSV